MEERPTAVHVWITELLNGKLIQNDDAPSAIVAGDKSIYKARIYGIVVSSDELIVDDGTGSILVRTFETPISINLGDPVLIIGKPRLYNQQTYILGEILKKIDKKWLEIREKQHPKPSADQRATALNLVRTLDKGDGADYNQVAAQIGKNGEELIVHLLSVGEIYETRPGKLKVLE